MNSVKFQKNQFLVLCLFQNTLKPKSSTCCSVRMLVELLNLERIEKLLIALQFVPGNVRNNSTVYVSITSCSSTTPFTYNLDPRSCFISLQALAVYEATHLLQVLSLFLIFKQSPTLNFPHVFLAIYFTITATLIDLCPICFINRTYYLFVYCLFSYGQ